MPAIEIRALDTRACDDKDVCMLAGRLPTDVYVTDKMTVNDAISAILIKLGSNQLSKLTMMMHGFCVLVEGNRIPAYGISVSLPSQLHVTRPDGPVSRIYGGYGLQFGSDDLDVHTVISFARLKGKFTADGLIAIYGCMAADTGPYINSKLSGDGPLLMKKLAEKTGASVRAADSLQQLVTNWYLKYIDRGAWSGRTYLFRPDGQQIEETICVY